MNDTNLPTVEQLLEAADRKVKELSRAIECLPKPLEGMGGSASERVANVIFLLQNAREERDRWKGLVEAHPEPLTRDQLRGGKGFLLTWLKAYLAWHEKARAILGELKR